MDRPERDPSNPSTQGSSQYAHPEPGTTDPSNGSTIREVYVRSMTRSGLGLSFWNPGPQRDEEAVTPGDVGTFSPETGFRRIFNVWDDERTRKFAPDRKVHVLTDYLQKGETFLHGATGRVINASDGQTPDRFEFSSRASEGAVLVVTSPAELVELVDASPLRDFIANHAALVHYQAHFIHRFTDGESLYIITGCARSESWASATFTQPLQGTLKLERRQAPDGTLPDDDQEFWWTESDNAATRTGASTQKGVKDQTLFARGFKLDLSQGFIAKFKTTSPPEDSPHLEPTSHGSTTSGGHSSPESSNLNDQDARDSRIGLGVSAPPGKQCDDIERTHDRITVPPTQGSDVDGRRPGSPAQGPSNRDTSSHAEGSATPATLEGDVSAERVQSSPPCSTSADVTGRLGMFSYAQKVRVESLATTNAGGDVTIQNVSNHNNMQSEADRMLADGASQLEISYSSLPEDISRVSQTLASSANLPFDLRQRIESFDSRLRRLEQLIADSAGSQHIIAGCSGTPISPPSGMAGPKAGLSAPMSLVTPPQVAGTTTSSTACPTFVWVPIPMAGPVAPTPRGMSVVPPSLHWGYVSATQAPQASTPTNPSPATSASTHAP